MEEIRIEFSIFAEPLEQQLKENGFKFKNEKYKDKYNKIIKSWNMLRMHDIATDSKLNKMAQRIIKKLSKDIVAI